MCVHPSVRYNVVPSPPERYCLKSLKAAYIWALLRHEHTPLLVPQLDRPACAAAAEGLCYDLHTICKTARLTLISSSINVVCNPMPVSTAESHFVISCGASATFLPPGKPIARS